MDNNSNLYRAFIHVHFVVCLVHLTLSMLVLVHLPDGLECSFPCHANVGEGIVLNLPMGGVAGNPFVYQFAALVMDQSEVTALTKQSLKYWPGMTVAIYEYKTWLRPHPVFCDETYFAEVQNARVTLLVLTEALVAMTCLLAFVQLVNVSLVASRRSNSGLQEV